MLVVRDSNGMMQYGEDELRQTDNSWIVFDK